MLPRSVVVVLLGLLCATAVAARDEGWIIERFDSRLAIQPDGTVLAREAIDVDFLQLTDRRGIFRDIDFLFFYNEEFNRQYPITLVGVTDADGRRQPVQTSTTGEDDNRWRFRIGDPDRRVSGKQTYRLEYRITQALNGFPTHDELYWNVTGVWPVSMSRASVVVTAPDQSIQRVECFQGPTGSTERCNSRFTPAEATFTASRRLGEGEQLTIVTGLRKGAVPEPKPLLVARPRGIDRFFDATTATLSMAGVTLLVTIGGLGALWWRFGRDRRFVSLHYLSQNASEERVPLFRSDPIVVEFEPPEKIRPAQMGLLIDESADTLDVTATIVDLGVRGYLSITELPKTGWFGKNDWQIDQKKDAGPELLEYERIVLDGLFGSTRSRKLSGLKNQFYSDLARAKKALYKDAVERGWFPANPNTIRGAWRFLGVIVIAAGVAFTIWLGRTSGRGLVGLPVILGGLITIVMAGAMARRTAKGREAMRRTLGFARYVRTGEARQQQFAERAQIFTAYLPYAIVFKCTFQWAQAFKDIDVQAATAGWYTGQSSFNPNTFSSSLGSLSSSMSSAIASTPGGSGSSGFGGGGSSGGGGGGGGGGSW